MFARKGAAAGVSKITSKLQSTKSHIGKKPYKFKFDIGFEYIKGIKEGNFFLKWQRGDKAVGTKPRKLSKKDYDVQLGSKFPENISLTCTLYRDEKTDVFGEKDSKLLLVQLKKDEEGKKVEKIVGKAHLDLAKYVGVPSLTSNLELEMNKQAIVAKLAVTCNFIQPSKPGGAPSSDAGSRFDGASSVAAGDFDDLDDLDDLLDDTLDDLDIGPSSSVSKADLNRSSNSISSTGSRHASRAAPPKPTVTAAASPISTSSKALEDDLDLPDMPRSKLEPSPLAAPKKSSLSLHREPVKKVTADEKRLQEELELLKVELKHSKEDLRKSSEESQKYRASQLELTRELKSTSDERDRLLREVQSATTSAAAVASKAEIRSSELTKAQTEAKDLRSKLLKAQTEGSELRSKLQKQEEQVTALKKSSDKVQQERDVLKEELLTARGESTALQMEAHQAQKSQEQLGKELQASQKGQEELKRQLQVNQKDHDTAKKELAQATARAAVVTSLEGEKLRLESQLQEQTQECERLREEQRMASEDRNDAEETAMALQKQLEEERKRSAEEVAAKSRAVADSEDEVRKLKSELQTVKDDMLLYKDSEADLTDLQTSLSKELASVRGELEEAKKQIKAAEERSAKADEKAGQLERDLESRSIATKKVESDAENQRTEVTSLTNKVAELGRVRDELERSLAGKETELAEQRELQASLETQLAQNQSEAEGELYQLQSQLATKEEELRFERGQKDDMASQLGAMRNELSAAQKAASEVAESVVEEEEERDTSVEDSPVEGVSEADSEIGEEQAQTLIQLEEFRERNEGLTAELESIRAEKLKLEEKLAKQAETASSAMAARSGSVERMRNEIESLRSEKNELETKLKDLPTQASSADRSLSPSKDVSLEALQQEIATLQEENEELRNQVGAASQLDDVVPEIVTEEAVAEQTQPAEAPVDEGKEALMQRYNELLNELSRLAQERDDLAAQVAAKESEIISMMNSKPKLARSNTSIQIMQEEREEMQMELMELRTKLSLNEDESAPKEEITEVRRSNSDFDILQMEKEEVREELKSAQESVSALRSEAESERKAREELRHELDEARKQVNYYSKQLSELQQNQQQVSSVGSKERNKENEDQSGEVSNDVAQLEEKLRQERLRLEAENSSIVSDLIKTKVELAETKELIISMASQTSSAKKTRKKIHFW